MIFGLILASIIAWFLSTVAGGGSSLILMPIIGLSLGALAIPPVITTGAIFGNSERSIAYWKKINWEVIKWELPGAIIGGCLGAFILTTMKMEWLGILIALFLLISTVKYIIKPGNKAFTVRVWYFLPVGFLYAFLSGIIGGTVPILLPLYLNYGLEKEELLGTQAINRLVVHLIKLTAYTYFGILKLPFLGYGIILGLAALIGNWLGHITLQKISEQNFKQLVVSFILFSAILMLWQQRQLLIFW